MGSSTPGFHRYKRIETANGGLERCKEGIVVREHSEVACFDTNADSCRQVFLRRLEPSIPMCL